ncbi:calcium/sodium antiporter [bacterium]|nr:calcium/sodium antiporter [bacterium]
MVYILFVIGFVFLIKGADFLVVGSSSVAKKYNVSDMVIGLTIVSMGTSLPELIVNLMASSEGVDQIAIGNVVGSNISNILLILGVSAIIYPLTIKQQTVISEIPYSLIAILLLAFLANAPVFNPDYSLLISRLDGLVLLLFFLLFMVYIVNLMRQGKSDLIESPPEDMLPISKSVIYIVLGVVGLFFGGKWVVDGAVEIATAFGLSEKLIGLTIIAIGTSLPELVTSAMAAYKKSTDIAVANVIGSNIFNLLWVLGLSAVIDPITFDPAINTDIIVLIAATCLIIINLIISRRSNLNRVEGIFFVFFYVAYVTYLVLRG